MKIEKHYSLLEIRKMMDASDSHWFDDDTLHFFKTRLGKCYSGSGGTYFVTSEKPPHGVRQHSVRQFHPKELRIETISGFCSLTNSQANRIAEELSENPLATIVQEHKESLPKISYSAN